MIINSFKKIIIIIGKKLANRQKLFNDNTVSCVNYFLIYLN